MYYQDMDENTIKNLKNKSIKNFVEVEGIIENEKIESNNKNFVVKMNIDTLNVIEDIETEIQYNLPQLTFNSISTSDFYQNYKGKLIKWKSIIEKKGGTWLKFNNLIMTPNLSLNLFKEGDEIEYQGKIIL
jgi:hypothetical protein